MNTQQHITLPNGKEITLEFHKKGLRLIYAKISNTRKFAVQFRLNNELQWQQQRVNTADEAIALVIFRYGKSAEIVQCVDVSHETSLQSLVREGYLS